MPSPRCVTRGAGSRVDESDRVSHNRVMATRVRELRDIDRLRPGIKLLGVRLKPIDILRRGEVDTVGMRSPTTQICSAPRVFLLLSSPLTPTNVSPIAFVPFSQWFP